MGSEIVPFAFDNSPVRVVTIDGEPWFVAVDVASTLQYTNTAKAIRDHVRAGQAKVNESCTPELHPQTVLINEAGLYRLIMRSNMPDAERFQDWVTDEVLPSIRKTGSYSVAPALPQTFAEALRLAADEHERAELAEQKVAELEPAAEQFEQWQHSPDTVYVVNWAKSIGLNQKEAFQALRELGVLFKQPDGSGMAFNVPKAAYAHLFELVMEKPPSLNRWVQVPKLTARGQVELHELLVENGWATK